MTDYEQLVASERRFRSLAENNLDVVLFQDREGTILDANPAFLALVHKPKAEVVHRLFWEFLPAEKVPLFQQKLAEAFEGIKVQFEVEVQLKGAEPKVLSVAKVPLVIAGRIAGVHMVAKDITEVTASQAIIRQQAKQLSTIFESITDAFFLLDREWRFVYVNGEVERLLSVTREQILGRNIWTVFPEEVGGVFQQHYERAVASRQAVHFEAFLERMQLWLDVKAFPSEEGLSVYFADVSDRVKAQQELYEQYKDLQQFTYIVSHNLRAPLANMLGLGDLLAALPKTSPDFTPTLDHLRASTRELDAVLHDMNTILAIRDKQDVAEPTPEPLAEVVRQVVQHLQEPLQQCGATVRVDIPAGLRVRANRAYLHSIFFNLLSNALKYRADERPLQVTVSAAAPGPEPGVEVVFADNGSGFDLQKAGADVFKLYKRFHTQPAGRGMGLYLVKTHVDAMSGRIEVRSEVNVGTWFVLHLP